MHWFAIIAFLLLMVPAALAGIISGLAQCLSHQPDPDAILEHLGALLEVVGPFGSGLLLMISGLAGLALTLALLGRQRG
ncbi:hypothetical protein IC757_05550 [Wenzhouxiangella sp. AB-CW3]|uniref:hypothetical protein n=1 Tax=Wenzhouxiangella sp. AB-CW3 TaxID=2771012 RepID=UPI00168A4FC8|nr:hypothetical protein [Wenzhouxiangella sp. AB-CW3]QOC23604.1 hypothetical protein IC757_05550 [Wenzhouxiangella sp. AB-CW3]